MDNDDLTILNLAFDFALSRQTFVFVWCKYNAATGVDIALVFTKTCIARKMYTRPENRCPENVKVSEAKVHSGLFTAPNICMQ